MTRYKNGQIPASALITIATGTNGDGYWEHQLSPSQKRKHDALVARARKRHGRTLKITSGWCAYRPLGPQRLAKQKYGSGAAAVGFSSHGGTYKGRDAMAMDYGNWHWVYNGDRAAFFEDCHAVGLAPGVIPSELWHVIDYDPWAPVPAPAPAGGASNTTKPAAEPEEEEEDMCKNSGFYYTRAADKAVVVLIANFGSGIYHEYSNGKVANGDYNGPLAATLGTGSYAPITESHARVIKAACDKADNLTVAVVNAA